MLFNLVNVAICFDHDWTGCAPQLPEYLVYVVTRLMLRWHPIKTG